MSKNQSERKQTEAKAFLDSAPKADQEKQNSVSEDKKPEASSDQKKSQEKAQEKTEVKAEKKPAKNKIPGKYRKFQKGK